MSQVPVLLSRTLDPVLGAFTGILAFYLNEHNPRTAPLPGNTLLELVRWKRNKWQQAREAREASESGSTTPGLIVTAATGVDGEGRARSIPGKERRQIISDAEAAKLGQKIEEILTEERR